MPAPVITPPLLLSLTKDQAMKPFTFYASEAPTSWASSTMPAGLSFNTTSGKITGTPTAEGTTDVSITATNASGTSAPVVFPINVTADPAAEDGLVNLNFDLQTGKVLNPSIAEGAPVVFGRNEDQIGIALGLVRDNYLRSLTITNIKMIVRDAYDEGEPVTVFDAAPGAPLDELAPRYRLRLALTAAEILASIKEHEGDSAASQPPGMPFELAAKAQITIEHTIATIDGSTSAVRSSVNFSIHLAKTLDDA